MATRRIGVVVRKSLHENFFQLVKSEFANHELMEIDVNAGDRGTGFLPFTRFIRLIVFACNAKSFAIAVIFFSFSFSFLFLNGLVNVFCVYLIIRYPGRL